MATIPYRSVRKNVRQPATAACRTETQSRTESTHKRNSSHFRQRLLAELDGRYIHRGQSDGNESSHVQNRLLRRRTGGGFVLRQIASENRKDRRSVQDRKNSLHQKTSRRKRIFRKVERLFFQVQFVGEQSRRDRRYIKPRIFCSLLIRVMESAGTDESHLLDAIKRQESSNSSCRRQLCGNSFPRSEILFFCQVSIIYVVTAFCLLNLLLGRGDSNLWSALLSGCLGYLLPSPTIRTK